METPPRPAPDASGDAVESPGPGLAPALRQRRPWTILGRISRAVREQNWFAVTLELGIVVLGVVIGFQVTAWGQDRADRAKEETYLRQIVADLRKTERTVREADARMAGHDRANAQLLRAFSQDAVPPRDSVLRWRYDADTYLQVQPVLGTIEAVVMTGDLALIRDPELRSMLTAYRDQNRGWLEIQSRSAERFTEATQRADNQFDYAEVTRGALSSEQLAALAAEDPLFTDGTGDRTAFPVDAEALVRDRESYAALRTMHAKRKALRNLRGRFGESARDLREQIEAELNR